MPQFVYKAKQGPRNIVTGHIQADTLGQAISKLIEAGQMPLEVTAQARSAVAVGFARQTFKVPRPALFQFTRQLADLLDAGIPLIRCMELCTRQRQFPGMVKVVDSMVVHLRRGESLSSALGKHPEVFSPLYIHVVKAAESSGQVPTVLNHLAQFLEYDMQMRKKIQASLLYPAIVLLVGMLTIFVLLSFVLPRLTVMFEDFDTALPLATQVVIGVSQFFAHFWWLMVGVVIAAVVWSRNFLSTPQGRAWADAAVLKVPLLKIFIENAQLSRFARTLGMLLESGVPVVQALESVVEVVDNSVLQEEVRRIAVKVKGGMSMTQAIRASPFFPDVAVDLIAVGQETGRMEKGLHKLAVGCERSTQEISETFITILGPGVLVLVVGIVGFMIVAMLLPMFQMNRIIN